MPQGNPPQIYKSFWVSTFKPSQAATKARLMFSHKKLGWRAGEFTHFSSHGQASNWQAVPPEPLMQTTTTKQVLSLKRQFMILRSRILSTYSVVLSSTNIFPTFPIWIPGSSTPLLGITKPLCHVAQAHLKQLILFGADVRSSTPLLLCESVQFFITSDSAAVYLSIWEETEFKEE